MQVQPPCTVSLIPCYGLCGRKERVVKAVPGTTPALAPSGCAVGHPLGMSHDTHEIADLTLDPSLIVDFDAGCLSPPVRFAFRLRACVYLGCAFPDQVQEGR